MIGGIYDNTSGKGARYILRFKGITRRSDSREKLERMLNGLRYEMDQGKFDPRDYQQDQPLSFTNISEKWLLKQKHKKSWGKMRTHIGYAQQYFNHTNVKEIKYGELEDFFYENPALAHLSSKSLHNIKTTLHTFWVWLCKRDNKIQMPEFPEISFELGWRKTIDKSTQDLILEKIREISWDINPRIYIGVLFLSTYTNVRPIELLHVKEEDIDLQNGTIIVKYNKVQGKHTVIYLIDEDIDLIRSIPRGFPKQFFFRHTSTRSGLKVTDMEQFGNKYLYKWWKKACNALGIEGVDLYGGTRHSTVTRLSEFYSPEEIMQDGSGHTTNKAFSRYFHRHAEQKKAISQTARSGKSDTKVIRLNVSGTKDKQL
ncbi:MAG: tyrosine-type recombinase/integrase [Deltaproteobacteria bacterium]|nr:tyrosine-type recombinase/integrase [Deltaproteobacteria bacterium]